jgi:hypothetical protein
MKNPRNRKYFQELFLILFYSFFLLSSVFGNFIHFGASANDKKKERMMSKTFPFLPSLVSFGNYHHQPEEETTTTTTHPKQCCERLKPLKQKKNK